MPRKPLGDRPMSNAERQARHRAIRAAALPVIHYRQAADHRSRARRWRDAVAVLLTLQAEYRAWLQALPEGLQEGAVPKRCRWSTISISPSSRQSNCPEVWLRLNPSPAFRVVQAGKQAPPRRKLAGPFT